MPATRACLSARLDLEPPWIESRATKREPEPLPLTFMLVHYLRDFEDRIRCAMPMTASSTTTIAT